MSNVDDKAAYARNAALRGAALAFAKPKPNISTKTSYGVPSKEVAAGAAAHLAHHKPPPGPVQRPVLSTAPSTASVRAAGLVVARREQLTTRQSSVELTVPSTNTSRPLVQQRSATANTSTRNRSGSPSNIAAALAASRHSSSSRYGSGARLSPQHATRNLSAGGLAYDGANNEDAAFSHRAVDIQTWMESLHADGVYTGSRARVSASGERSYPFKYSSTSGHSRRTSQRSVHSVLTEGVDVSPGEEDLHRGRSIQPVRYFSNIPAIDIATASPQKQYRQAEHPSFADEVAEESLGTASLYSDDDDLETPQIVTSPIQTKPTPHIRTTSGDYFSQKLHHLPSLNTTSLSLTVHPSTAGTPKPVTESSTRPSEATTRRHSIAPTLRKYNPDLKLSKWAETVVAQPSPSHSTTSMQQAQAQALANAMIAGHLATSRASSRVPSPDTIYLNPAFISRKSTEYNLTLTLPRRSLDVPPATRIRTPSPNKALRPTLRKTNSSPTEDEKRYRRKHFYQRKHPHKHNEGDRKRWRDAITIRERKRYEGVWAANRGTFLPGEDDQTAKSALDIVTSCVSNIVVRDIWQRSRLPANVLEEVWELVDRSGLGRLDREEFVVGMWLIDQRLKGRKLPVKVSSSIWNSVRGIYGLKMPKVRD